MIYFTSDTHFFHHNIIHLNNRPFKDFDQMQKTLIRNWNSLVSNYDEIYILGDLIHKGTALQANQLLSKLNGTKYLIRGNHDSFLKDQDFDQSAFVWIKDYYVLNYKKTKFVLFHYPILEWDGYFSDTIHLYGHVHNATKNPIPKKRLQILGNHAFHVGVDTNNYFPVNIETIIKKCSIN